VSCYRTLDLFFYESFLSKFKFSLYLLGFQKGFPFNSSQNKIKPDTLFFEFDHSSDELSESLTFSESSENENTDFSNKSTDTNLIGLYLDEVKKYPLLKPDQEYQTAKAMMDSNEDVCNRLRTHRSFV